MFRLSHNLQVSLIKHGSIVAMSCSFILHSILIVRNVTWLLSEFEICCQHLLTGFFCSVLKGKLSCTT